MNDKDVWPKLALFDSANPVFGVIRDSPEAPIKLVKPGNPPTYFGIVDDLVLFCHVFRLDYPAHLDPIKEKTK